MVKRIDFRKGSGETLAFLPALIGMMLLLFYFVAIVQLSFSVTSVTNAAETVGRAVSVCSSQDDAMVQAQRVAESIISYNCIRNVETYVEPLEGDTWDAGMIVLVTVVGDIRTVEPLLLSGKVTRKVVVTVEYSRRRTSDSTLSGDSHMEQCFRYLRSCGFSAESAAAVVGNLVQESGCDPEAVNGNAAGIAQWNPGTELYREAAAEGQDWKSLAFQLSFLVQDMPSGWTGSASSETQEYIRAGIVEPGVSYADFRNLTDVSHAADVFCAYYEQCHLSEACLDNRREQAEVCYALYAG